MKKKRITITGGRGFLGKHLIRAFEARGYENILVADLPDYNLTRPEDIRRLYDEQRPDVVVHLAAKVGGIGYNQENPGSLFYENIMMGVPLLHEGYLQKIDKFVALGTICAYPKFTPVPFKEDDLWNGYPEETNAPYGLAKKMIACPVSGLPPAVRLQLHLPAAGQPLRPRRQLRSPLLPRYPGPHQKVRRCRAAGG